jgi:hypothetical protein
MRTILSTLMIVLLSTSCSKASVQPATELAVTAANKPASDAAAHSVELSKLVDTFLLPADADNNLGWSVGSTPDSPIEWQTSGIDDGSKCGVKEAFCRKGSAIVTVNGKITHEVLEKNIQPGKWIVTLAGSRNRVSNVSIQSDTNSEELEGEMSWVLTKSNMKLNEIKCPQEPETVSDGSTLYEIISANKKPAWLLSSWSCGNAGCKVGFDIYYSLEDTQGLQCSGY